MKKRSRNTAKGAGGARHTAPAPLPDVEHGGEEAAMSEEEFDKAMRALLGVPWSAKKWRKKRERKKRERA